MLDTYNYHLLMTIAADAVWWCIHESENMYIEMDYALPTMPSLSCSVFQYLWVIDAMPLT